MHFLVIYFANLLSRVLKSANPPHKTRGIILGGGGGTLVFILFIYLVTNSVKYCQERLFMRTFLETAMINVCSSFISG